MRSHHLNELTIKVPGPFAGISDLGFTAQYRAQELNAPLSDVPLVIEGPSVPIRRLAELLCLLRDAEGTTYRWTDPIMLGDGVLVLAFRDRSLAGAQDTPLVLASYESGLGLPLPGGGRPPRPGAALADHVLNLVRPVVFPFLHDCAAVAHLRLSERIEMRVTAERSRIDMALPVDEIVEPNGDRLLWPLAG